MTLLKMSCFASESRRSLWPRSLVRALLPLLVLLGCAGNASAVSDEPYIHTPSGIVFPNELAGFTQVSVYDFEPEQRGAGVRVRYQTTAGLPCDVYIYNYGVPLIPSGVDHPLMEQLRRGTEDEIREFLKAKGGNVENTESARLDLQTKKGIVPVLFDAFVITLHGQTRASFLWLWAARNHFFKIRTTPVSSDRTPASVQEFTAAIAELTMME